MDAPKRMGRKLIVDLKPNRLFMKYLTEWRDEASGKGDRSYFTYNKALQSLKKYPLPLQCGEEAKILENFGDKICKMLDSQLAKDAAENGLSPAEHLEQTRKVPSSWWEKVNKEAPVASKKPAKRKKTAGKVKEHAGTGKQTQLAFTKVPVSDMSNVTTTLTTSTNTRPTTPEIILHPGQFTIVLCVDTRETMGESRKKEMGQELDKQNICYEQRTLQIGDFLWIAQEKPHLCQGQTPKELVLDYIVERKILSDLAMSIKDGRFREQKMRLKQSGLRHIIYLIENMDTIDNQSLPEQTLRQASYNTQIVDNICVKYTKNAKATVAYLDLMTKRLQRLYDTCTLQAGEESESQETLPNVRKLTPFTTFNELGSKHRKLTVNEMFTRQLMQIHGVSYDKAFAITSIYPTPLSLVKKYRSLETDKEKEALLSNVKFGLTQRNLGIAISRTVSKMYT